MQASDIPLNAVGLVGESGNGKSTLLRAIAGLHRADQGRIRYKGAELAPTWSERSASQRREKQRVAIARAFAAEPTVLLCDEIVSALDVSVQAVVMRLIRDYVERTGASAIFVSHDLPVVRMMSSKVMVLNRGHICESGPTRQVFHMPSDPYTRRLVASLPQSA